MIECERILSKGKIPNSFIKEEIRDGFLVDMHRKKIWIIQIDMLFEIDRICKKYDLKYFTIGGNLIGAVRHQGFIPWDDDIDIAMMRKDYDRFCEVCAKELDYPYFFQTTYTENNCHCDFARICNSETTGMRDSIKEKKDVNKGIFLDVFPLDALPNGRFARMLLLKRVYFRTVVAVANSLNVNPNPITRFLHFITNVKLFHLDLKKWDRKTERIISSVDLKKAKDVGLVVRTIYPYDRVIWRKECFQTIEWVPFEFFQIPIPGGYDEILTVHYEDYMKFPPVEKRGTWHGNVLFEPDIPYKQYEQQ